MTKQLLGYGAAVMTTLLALMVLWQFRIVVVYVLISLALAAALYEGAGISPGTTVGFGLWAIGVGGVIVAATAVMGLPDRR